MRGKSRPKAHLQVRPSWLLPYACLRSCNNRFLPGIFYLYPRLASTFQNASCRQFRETFFQRTNFFTFLIFALVHFFLLLLQARKVRSCLPLTWTGEVVELLECHLRTYLTLILRRRGFLNLFTGSENTILFFIFDEDRRKNYNNQNYPLSRLPWQQQQEHISMK